MTAVALLCRLQMGANDDADPLVPKYAQLLRLALPVWEPGVRVDT